ncbi:ribbon-helix-helix protein, CopG family [Weissella cibaria]|nr:ribbon-helix-helix protein, CopG family [Weissella cibaria]MBU7545396.1 ribbon-helix-helix protein, CopG family [Weissella cibaria]MCV3318705.1 ribbon-helix-helix domain-containing protein [Weissella cibaria]
MRTSFSIKKTNVDKLDELVNKLHAKSRSELLDILIEKGYDDFI